MNPPGLINWLRLLAVSLIWGGAFMGVSFALRDFEPLQLAATRVGIGALALYGLMRLRGVRFPPLGDKRLWLNILVIAFLSTALPFALLSWGQQHVPSAFAGMSMAAVPLFILPLAHGFIPGEQMTLRKIIGFAVGFTGAMLLVGTGGLSAAQDWTTQLAQIACLSAALCYAVNSILTKRCPPVNELALSTAALGLAFVMLAVAGLAVEGLPRDVSTTGFVAIIYLGLLPTAAAYVLKVAIVRSAGPSFMSFVNYLVPCWSVLLGGFVMQEALPGSLFYALGLILLGLALSQWGTIKALFTRSQPSKA